MVNTGAPGAVGGGRDPSISRSRTSVFRRALSSVGLVSKEDRLIAAADGGDAAGVVALLSAGADVNYQNDHGESALMYAAWRGFEAVVAALLQHPATHVNLQWPWLQNISSCCDIETGGYNKDGGYNEKDNPVPCTII
ncbi:hypothetical protein Pcinc_019497 [Petrolisthes cinctipes]|uniref:Uncharacterized protein n=1 Tax=Petrolisthes cinctipes TaxID=88211 RepID=A0AAE1FPT2_PETCI|nr:hypothetical protein Pcinc_019497 [Petrolisthes cinctipes]